MIRWSAFSVFLLVFSVSALFSSQGTDVLYLKNGNVFCGEIIEQNLGVDIKLKTDGGKIIVFPQALVAKIAKQSVIADTINQQLATPKNAEDTLLDTSSESIRSIDTTVAQLIDSTLLITQKIDSASKVASDTIYYIDSTISKNNPIINDSVPKTIPAAAETTIVNLLPLNEEYLFVSRGLRKVVLKTGSVIIGRITHITKGKEFTVRTNAMKEYTVKYSEVASVTKAYIAKHGSIGVGYGIPYGIAGASLDVALFDFVHLTGAIGYTVLFPDLAWNAGVKVYLLPSGNVWRPRLLACYGTNSLLMVSGFSSDINESCGGLTLGLGQILTFGERKNNGFDFDVLCIVTSNIYDRVKILEEEGMIISKNSLGRLKIAVGYRFCF